MKDNALIATTKEGIQTTFSFKNEDLNKFSTQIAKIAIDSVSRNVQLAKIFGRVLDTQCYKEDGFKSVADFAYQTFGINENYAYQLAKVGNRFYNVESETAEKVVSILGGKVGNLAEIASMSDEDIEKAIASGDISAETNQRDLRNIATAAKPQKVKTEKRCNLTFVISEMSTGKIHGDMIPGVVVDNNEFNKALGFESETLHHVKLFNNEQVVHREGKEDTKKVTGFTAIAYTEDGMFLIRYSADYIEIPKEKKATKKSANTLNLDTLTEEQKAAIAAILGK